MMPRAVRRFLSEKFYSCVSPNLLLRFFERYGDALPKVDLGHGSEAQKRARLRPVVEALEDPKAAKVVEDLERLAVFSREPLFTALVERAEAMGAGGLWRQPGVKVYERRAMLLMAFIGCPELFDRAEEWLAVRMVTNVHEWQGVEPREIDLGDEARRQFERGASAMYGRLCGEGYCRCSFEFPVSSFESGRARESLAGSDGVEPDVRSGRIAIVLFHGDLPTSTVAIEEKREVPLAFRELEESVLIYDIESARLQVSARTETEREMLVALFAREVIGDAGFFAHPDARNLYDLERVMREGLGFRLSDPDPAIVSQRVVEVQGRSLDKPGQVMVLRDDEDAWRAFVLRAGRSGLDGWKLEHMVVRLELVACGRKRTRRVHLKPPAVARFDRTVCEQAVVEYIRRNGFGAETGSAAAAVEWAVG